MNRTSQRILLLISLSTGILQGCQNSLSEVKSHEAETGDVLVRDGDTTVELMKPFKPGQPNGLYDGGVTVRNPGQPTRRAEVNAVCSLPNLPNWPQYDNIYGRWLVEGEKPGDKGGDTDWQLLIDFNGKTVNKGRESAPRWAMRLAQNLCRKGDFQDG